MSNFFMQFLLKSRFFQANFRRISIFSGNFTKNFDFPGKNRSFTATSEQIILCFFKTHRFRTYFLYIIGYNISRARTTPRLSLPKIGGSRPPTPRIDAPGSSCAKLDDHIKIMLSIMVTTSLDFCTVESISVAALSLLLVVVNVGDDNDDDNYKDWGLFGAWIESLPFVRMVMGSSLALAARPVC